MVYTDAGTYSIVQLRFVFLLYIRYTLKKSPLIFLFNQFSSLQLALYKNSGTLDILSKKRHLNHSEQTQ